MMAVETIDKELEKELFDSLDERLTRADIAFKAYARGKADAMMVLDVIKARISKVAEQEMSEDMR